jgi:sugar phosphate isomerase/epimerase
MPQLAVFPKFCLDDLCVSGSMSLKTWIEMASQLDIDGLEMYCGIRDLQDPAQWELIRQHAADHGMQLPMMCCSPDFTHPDPAIRAQQIEAEKQWIRMTAALGGKYCRVLSGQRRPDVSREQGLGFAASCIEACFACAEEHGVILILENHYKDNYWEHPEFAQHMDVFCDLVDRLHSPYFGVNYDPSNTLLAGEDPLELLERVKHRVVTMHASDRYLAHGTLEDLRREEDVLGYAKRLQHGEIGKGLNDYDAIFGTLCDVGFDGWVSVEDGVEGMDQLARSVAFLRGKMGKYWPAST